MTIKEVLLATIKRTGVEPPFTRRQIEAKGFNVSEFLKTLASELSLASDSSNKQVQKFIEAVKKIEASND